MAKQNQQEVKDKNQSEKVVDKVSATEQFFNDHSKAISACILAIVVIGLGILAYNRFYLQPKKAEAMQQMYPAEASFRDQDFELALNGDGNVLGFEQIISEYGSKAGKSVYYYAGVCNLQNGDYEKAIKYLKKYNGKEPILAARAAACIGDAYVGLEDYKTALNWFDKAAGISDDIFAANYLLKAGVVCEELGDSDKALAYYKTIKDKYPQSIEGYDIDKYITRIESRK